MNPTLYLICKEYVKCYEVLDCLIHLDGLQAESLKLFRLSKERTEQLEEEIIHTIIEKEVKQ